MNKEAFDLFCQKVSANRLHVGSDLHAKQQTLADFLAMVSNFKATSHKSLRDLVTSNAISPKEMQQYRVDPSSYASIAERINSLAAKSPALKYDDLSVTRSVPASAARTAAGGASLAGGLTALLGRRFAPLAKLKNIGLAALGGGGVGAAKGTHSTMSDNRSMTAAKNMLGSEYGLRTVDDFKRVAPVAVPSQRTAFMEKYK